MTVNTAPPSTEVVRELVQVEHNLCPECGTVIEDHFSTDLQLEKQRSQKLERELAAAQRTISKFERGGVKPGLVEDIFQLWVNVNGKQKNTKLTPDRRKAINAALKLYGEADVRKVVTQNSKTPYLVYTAWRTSGNRDSLRDITDFLGKGKHFDALLEMANVTAEINWTEDKVAAAQDLLLSTEAVLDRLHEGKGWTAPILEQLGVGLGEGRLIFPIRDESGTLTGVVKYHPRFRDADRGLPKSLADGPRGFFPAPESVDSPVIWLVEGEPDAVTAHEMWLPGVAIPGVALAPGEWMKRFEGKKIVLCFDCDIPGRQAANKLARPLTQYAIEVRIVDLDPEKSDGYDLTDWFRQGRTRKTLLEMAKKSKPVDRFQAPPLPQQTRSFDPNPNDYPELFDDFVRALEQRGCGPKEGRGGQWIARCPVHDDRVRSLDFSLGEKTPVVAHCKVGCKWTAIKEVLAWPARKEF